MGEAYREIDLEDNPCIFPQCGHFLTIESMDGLMDMKKHYEFSPEGVIVSAKQSSEPFSMDESKTCATCRASLRNLSRYGRIVRRALLDESTKKFILWANGRYVRLAETLQELQHQLSESMETFKGLKTTSAADAVHTKGNRAQQLLKIRQLDTASRYKAISTLRGDIAGFLSKVKKEEQPFQKVWEIVQHARRRRGTTKDFNFDRSVLQTRGFVLASALMLRCDLAIMSDFVAVWQSKRTSASPIAGSFQLDSSQSRQDCLALINLAATQPMVQVEGHVFFAQYAILECSTTTTELAVLLKEEAEANLKTARTLCAQNRVKPAACLKRSRAWRRCSASLHSPVLLRARSAALFWPPWRPNCKARVSGTPAKTVIRSRWASVECRWRWRGVRSAMRRLGVGITWLLKGCGGQRIWRRNWLR